MLSSCEQEKIKPEFTTTQGKMSVRVINKNDDSNIPYSSYKEASLLVHWASGNNILLLINGDYLNSTTLNPISRGFQVGCIRNMDAPTPRYQAITVTNQNYQISKFFDGTGFGYDSRSTSLDATNINESLTFTKDDADSLVGNFRVRLETIAPNSIDTITVEGRFSFAKNGVFNRP